LVDGAHADTARPRSEQPLPSLDRPAGEVLPHVPARADVYVVRRDDCLWTITARHLDGPANDRAVAARWPRWYAANRAVIGVDPDVLHPGQHLVVPKERS
jgi:nucleoid-associated protein YgaU